MTDGDARYHIFIQIIDSFSCTSLNSEVYLKMVPKVPKNAEKRYNKMTSL